MGNAQFMAGFGLQCSGTAAEVPMDLWPQALNGMQCRFPNFEGDVVLQHVGLFTAMAYSLIEVTVSNTFINQFDPQKGGDHRVSVMIDWSSIHASPFSLAKSLGPPPAVAQETP